MTESYTFVLKGYDVAVEATDNPDVYHVELFEGNALVHEQDVPITLEEDPDLYVSDIIDHAAEAAIDMYENSKGTLGQGAGAEIEAQMKRAQIAIAPSQPIWYPFQSSNREDWLNQLKGTPYEQEAILLLDQLIELSAPGASNVELDDLCKRKDQIVYDLDKLNLERMKTSKPNQQIIIIQASKRYVDYEIEKSTISSRPGYMAKLYKEDGSYETTFGRTKEQVKRDAEVLMGYDSVEEEMARTSSHKLAQASTISSHQKLMDAVYVVLSVYDEYANGEKSEDQLSEAMSRLEDALFGVEQEGKFASRKLACDLDWVEGFLNAFKGCKQEAQAILKVKELIDIQSAIDLASASRDDKWKQEDDLRKKMDELLVMKTKNDVDARLPESGIEVAPEMASDLAELMSGVSFAEPLQPMFAKRGQDDQAIKEYVEKALGRMFSLMSRPEQEGDVEEYEKIRNAILTLKDEYPQVFDSLSKGWAIGSKRIQGQEDTQFSIKVVDTINDEEQGGKVVQDVFAIGKQKAVEKFKSFYKKYVEGKGERYLVILKDPDGTIIEQSGGGDSLPEDMSEKTSKRLQSQEDKEPFHLEEFGEELGKKHEFLDPAEVPEEDLLDFQVNDKIKLKNAVEVPLSGGTTLTIDKGTKGWVTSLWDGHGDVYVVRLEDGSTFSTNVENLSKAS